MTEQARHKLSKAVGEAIEAFVEEVTPKPKPPSNTEEDLDRPMSHEELEELCIHIPTAVIGYITGMSNAGVRNFFLRRVGVPQDVASKVRRLHRLIEELAAEKHVHRRGGARPRESPPPDTGKEQEEQVIDEGPLPMLDRGPSAFFSVDCTRVWKSTLCDV